MAWTYAQVKAADAALNPAQADPALAAAALNAQTTALAQPASDIGLGDIQGVLLLSGDWLKIQTEAAKSGATGATTDPITLSILAIQLVQSKAATVAAANWTSFVGMLQVLEANSVVSSASLTAIQALATMTVPTWQPALLAGDVQTARAQP